ncbi:MAG: LuxR C-terminal-related transcriptional regulator [Pseudomonadota bacterium]
MKVEDFSKLTALIYAGALDQSKWADFLVELSALTGGVKTHMFGYDHDTETDLGLIGPSYDPDFLQSFASHYADTNVWAKGFVTFDPGRAIHVKQMCPTDVFEKSEWYNDWIRPQEDAMGGGGALIFKEDRRMFALGGNIRRKDIDRLESDWLQTVNLLFPHVQHAFELSRSFTFNTVINQLDGHRPLQRTSTVVVVTLEGVVTYSVGQQVTAGEEKPFTTDLKGRLRFYESEHNHKLDHVIELAKQGRLYFPMSFHVQSAKRPKRAWNCRISGFDPTLLDEALLDVLSINLGPVLVVSLDEIGLDTDVATTLKKQFGLTAREAQIVLQIANGLSPREISERDAVSVHTVRNQLKSGMSKMDVRRQSEIVRTIMLSRP